MVAVRLQKYALERTDNASGSNDLSVEMYAWLRQRDVLVVCANEVGDAMSTMRNYQLLPYMIHVYRAAYDAFLLRRMPKLKRGITFSTPLVSAFWKKSENQSFPPKYRQGLLLMKMTGNSTVLLLPDVPRKIQMQSHEYGPVIIKERNNIVRQLERQGQSIFLYLEEFWKECEGRLVDAQLEFSLNNKGNVCLIAEINTALIPMSRNFAKL